VQRRVLLEQDSCIEEKTKMSQDGPQIPAGLFTMAPENIVEFLTSREKFREGPAVGMRMLAFYLSYAGKRLSPFQLRRLERAKKMLALRVEQMLRGEQRQAA
jgi:hypothetical protein